MKYAIVEFVIALVLGISATANLYANNLYAGLFGLAICVLVTFFGVYIAISEYNKKRKE